MAPDRRPRGRRVRGAYLLFVSVVGLAASVWGQSDPLCPHITACEYEAPAFSIRIVDQQTGQALGEVHAIATWLVYGGPRRRGPLIALEAVSGPDGRLSFPAWGPVRSGLEGVLPGSDPMISLFRPGYRAMLIYNAGTPGPHTARVRAFDQAGQTFGLAPFQGTTGEAIVELRKARNPFDGATPSDYDPEAVQRAYVSRLQLVMREAERLPREWPDVERLLWGLGADIRSHKIGGAR